MQYIIVAIYDKAVENFGRPFVARTANEAIRTISQEVNRADTTNMLNTHPRDYDLYQLGTWDDETGEVRGGTKERIVQCEALKTKA